MGGGGVASVAELKKAIEELMNDGSFHPSYHLAFKAVLEKVGEFEAGVREEDNLYKAALSNWGEEAQVKMAIEECAELIQVLAKYGRNINGASDFEVQSEIADVQVMLNQLKIIFDEDAIAEVKATKLEKLRKLLGGGSARGER